MRQSLTLFLTALLLTACDADRVFEQNQDIPGHQWFVAAPVSFSFDIQDLSRSYNLYYNIRNAVSYPYQRLYVTYYLNGPDGKRVASKLQMLLLMDPQTGRPLGDGLGDIFDHQITLQSGMRFKAKGKYTLSIKQYMREDPLPDIMSVGLRVEKAAD